MRDDKRSANDDDEELKQKSLTKSKMATILKHAGLEAPNRLILILDYVLMPAAKAKDPSERAVRYVLPREMTTEQVLAHFSTIENTEGRPARIPEFCDWCGNIYKTLPYTVALGTSWKEHNDPQEWVAFVDQLDEQRLFTADRITRVWAKGTGFLFFVKTKEEPVIAPPVPHPPVTPE